MRHVPWLAAFATLIACNGLLDLDRFSSSEGAGGSTSSIGDTGGVGGTGGGGASPHGDWRNALPLSYTFSEDASLGTPSGGLAFESATLEPIPGTDGLLPMARDVSPAESYSWLEEQGSSLYLSAEAALRAPEVGRDFDVAGEGSFSFGGWVRIDPDAKERMPGDERYDAVMGQFSFFNGQWGGWVLQRQETDGLRWLRCIVRDNTGLSAVAVSSVNAWRDDRWVHVACVYDEDEKILQAFVDGEPSGPGARVDFTVGDPVGRRFQIGGRITGEDNGLTGWADELFFVKEALTPFHIARLFSCGIDGRHCACDAASPSAYASCGFWSSNDCTSLKLPPCDASFAEVFDL